MIPQPRDRLATGGTPSGSVAIVARALAGALSPHARVSLLVARRRGEPEHEVLEDGTEVWRIAFPGARYHDFRLALSGLLWQSPRPYFQRRACFAGFYRRIARRLEQLRPDIVHVHGFAQALPMLRDAVPSARFVLHFHDPHPGRCRSASYRAAISAADAILGCSEYVAGRIREAMADAGKPVLCFPNGIAEGAILPRVQREPPASGRPRLLFVGRITPEKGLHLLFRALPRLVAEWPGLELQVVGKPGFLPLDQLRGMATEEEVQALLAFYGRGWMDRAWRVLIRAKSAYLRDLMESLPADLRGHVRIEPPRPHAEIFPLYDHAHLLVQPNLVGEPFGLPVVEALARGCPVVGSGGGALPELIQHGRQGLLFEPGNERALTDAILRLLGDPAGYTRMCAAAPRRAALFTWERATPLLLVLYRALRTRAALEKIPSDCLTDSSRSA